MAHSLGNMVVSSMIHDYGLQVSKYLMCNSAVPTETYDASIGLRTPKLVHPEWEEYPTNSWSASWYTLFKDDPAIGKMTKSALLAFLMRKYGVAPKECAIVGDTKSDFVAAKDNGIESVGVVWGYGKPDELALADRIAHTPAEV